VRLFAAAAHAAGHAEVQVSARELTQALAIVTEMAADPARFAAVLSQCSVLVDGAYHSPGSSLALPSGVTVDVLPPFAGG
jgi:molybdopterin converting factor small subunit